MQISNTQKFTGIKNLSNQDTKQLILSNKLTPGIRILFPKFQDVLGRKQVTEIVEQYKNAPWMLDHTVFAQLDDTIEQPIVIFFGKIIQMSDYSKIRGLLNYISAYFAPAEANDKKNGEAVKDREIVFNTNVQNFAQIQQQLNKGLPSNW